MTKRKATGITRQHVEALRTIRGALNLAPLEADVLDELIERATAHAHNAAVIRVRIKNLGRSPAEKARFSVRKPRYIPMSPNTMEWTTADLDRLTVLFGELPDDTAIGEQMGRTAGAVKHQRQKLGLLRPRYVPPCSQRVILAEEARQGFWMHPEMRGPRQETPLQRARRVLRERNTRGERVSA